MIGAVVFDVGECLVDETREYGTWADWLGVPRHVFSVVFGAVIARFTSPIWRDVGSGRSATVGHAIYFQHPDGTWESDLQPDQIILEKVIRLDPLRLRIDKAARRSADDAGQVEKRRGVHASAPVFAGTRIPVATVQRYMQEGLKLTRS